MPGAPVGRDSRRGRYAAIAGPAWPGAARCGEVRVYACVASDGRLSVGSTGSPRADAVCTSRLNCSPRCVFDALRPWEVPRGDRDPAHSYLVHDRLFGPAGVRMMHSLRRGSALTGRHPLPWSSTGRPASIWPILGGVTPKSSNLGGRPLARRARLSWPQERRQASEVVISRVDPGRGWTLEQARDLVRQGYSVEHVAGRTGFPEQMLKVAEETDESEEAEED